MKRFIKLLGLFLIVATTVAILSISAFAACSHNWEYESGTIDVKNHCLSTLTYRCSLCNETKTETGTNSHKPNGTYTASSGYCVTYCKECGDAIRSAHNYVFKSRTAESTCTQKGTEIWSCSRCGNSETRYLDMKPHTPANGVVTTEATCTKAGVMTYSCFVCHAANVSTSVIPATGHKMGIWVANANGQHARGCQNMYSGCAYTEYAAHTFSGGSCTVCGYVKSTGGSSSGGSSSGGSSTGTNPPTTDTCNHVWGNWIRILEPTYTSYGANRRQCSECGKYEIQEIPYLDCPHLYDSLTDAKYINENNHEGTCPQCNKKVTALHQFSDGKICTVCGYNANTGEKPSETTDIISGEIKTPTNQSPSSGNDDVPRNNIFPAVMGGILLIVLCYWGFTRKKQRRR